MGLNKKMSQIMAKVGTIPMNGYNSFHKYAYVTEADILNFMRPLLVEFDITLHVSCVDQVKEGEFTRALMEFTLVDNESGEQAISRFWGEGQDKGDKGYYKAYTGAQKYFFMKTFMLVTGDDPERDAPSANRPTQQRPQQQSQHRAQGQQQSSQTHNQQGSQQPSKQFPRATLVAKQFQQDEKTKEYSALVKLATVEDGEKVTATAKKKEVLSLLKTSNINDIFFFKVESGELIALKLAQKSA